MTRIFSVPVYIRRLGPIIIMNFAWIVQGIRDVKESRTVRHTMDKIYSLVNTEENETRKSNGQTKRKRGASSEDYDYDHTTTKH